MSRRLLPDARLLVASHNPGKVAEIIELVAPFGLQIATAAELALPEPEETGSTFVANAEPLKPKFERQMLGPLAQKFPLFS